MKVKEFIKLLKKINPEAHLLTGNITGYKPKTESQTELNLYNFWYECVEEQDKDLTKIENVVLWSDE